MLPSGSMTSKVVVSPPSRSRPPPDPPPRKAPPLGSLSLREPLEPPDPPDPSDAAPAPALLWFISTSPISRLSSAFHPDVPLPLCFICPSSSLRTSLISDLSSTAWTSSRGDGSCQTSDLKTIRCALSFSSPWTMTVLPKGKIYFTWFWLINLLSDDHLTLLCSPQTPLLSPHPHNNDQWLSSDSRKSLWVHHGNAGVDRFCWELRQVPSEIGVKPILLLTGVEESSSLLSISFQERSHFTPFAITSHIQQVLNMLYPLLSCSHLCNYAVDLKKEMPSSETYGLGIVGLSFIINAVDGVFTSISSEFRHQRGSPTCPNSHVRFILDLAQSHPLLEDCSPVALKQKANQTSSCRGHERTFAPECKNCLMLPYSVASSKGIFPKSPLKRQSSRGAQLKSLGDFDRSWKDFKMFINQPATTKPGICSHFHTMTEYSEKLLESGFINTLWYRYGNIGIESLLLAICHAFSPSLVKLFCCFTGVMMARSSSSSSLVHHCPLKLSFQDKFMKMFSRQGRERSPSTSSFQERTFSPQSLFLRGDSHPVLETWIITDVGISTSHSTTAPFVASPLIAETLASQNAMISAYSYGTFSLSLEALYKKLPVFVHDSNRLTYPFIALVFLSVTSEFYSLTDHQSFDLEDWLPITASRNANWYYSAFHNVTAMVGAGVLGLPYAMSELGWGPGVAVLILSWVITLYTLWQMIEMHEMFEGQRFDRYHELGQAAFGRKLGLYIIVPLQLLVETSACIIYMVTGGESLKKVHQLSVGDDKCTKLRIEYFILIFASSQFVLSLLKNFNSISGVSLVAAVMSVSYSTIAWVASLAREAPESVEYGYKKRTNSVPLDLIGGLGEIAFAYAGHNVVLEIQATIPSTPENPSKRPMWKGAIVAYLIVAFCYFPVALIGFKTFGNNVEENILTSLHDPKALIILANMFVVVHLLGSYQVYAMPVFDMIESVMIRKWHFRPTRVLRFSIRWTFVAATMGIAVALPYFSALLSFFGGFVFAPTTYFIPCIIWLILKKPKRFSLSWCINWSCIILGVVLMIIAPIGGLAKLRYQIKHKRLPNSNYTIT